VHVSADSSAVKYIRSHVCTAHVSSLIESHLCTWPLFIPALSSWSYSYKQQTLCLALCMYNKSVVD